MYIANRYFHTRFKRETNMIYGVPSNTRKQL